MVVLISLIIVEHGKLTINSRRQFGSAIKLAVIHESGLLNKNLKLAVVIG